MCVNDQVLNYQLKGNKGYSGFNVSGVKVDHTNNVSLETRYFIFAIIVNKKDSNEGNSLIKQSIFFILCIFCIPH